MAFSRRHIRTRLARAGFTDVRVAPRDFLLPNTPAALVPLAVGLGDRLESIPLLRHLSPSLFISARGT